MLAGLGPRLGLGFRTGTGSVSMRSVKGPAVLVKNIHHTSFDQVLKNYVFNTYRDLKCYLLQKSIFSYDLLYFIFKKSYLFSFKIRLK